MDKYREAILDKVAEVIAKKLNAHNAKYNIFENIAAMQCEKFVNMYNLHIWADTTIDYMLDDDSITTADLNIAELYFISQYADRVVQQLNK